MKKALIAGGVLSLGLLLVVVSFVARSGRTSGENMVRERREAPGRGPGYMFQGSRTGLRAASTGWGGRWSGTLVDAGCPNRDSFTQTGPSASIPAAPPAENLEPLDASPGGAPVNAPVRIPERADAEAQQTPEALARNSDTACAVTALTRGFALRLPNGEMKNLDEGGNTKAAAAFQESPRGQAVLNGRSAGDRPRAVVTGIQEGDRIVVEEIELR